MAGYIHEFFGYRFDDHSDTALKAAEKQFCPFIGELCTKPLGRDGERSGGACLIVCVSVFCLKGLMHDE